MPRPRDTSHITRDHWPGVSAAKSGTSESLSAVQQCPVCPVELPTSLREVFTVPEGLNWFKLGTQLKDHN